ncbi:MAG: phosphate acetyltransferase [Acholeplasmataceae bacterium]|nr:phosphate acetyltransferase [Acholeplasmataceae bacterium]
MFKNLINNLKQQNIIIIFPDGDDIRVLTACSKLANQEILTPVVLGDKIKIEKLAKENKLDISKIEFVDINNYPEKEAMVELMLELRKGKMTEEEVRKSLEKGNYFGTMIVKIGYAHGLLGGATYSTADTVRPALQLIKTKPGTKIVSSSFVLVRKRKQKEEKYIFADCAINLHPNEDDLVEIAIQSAETARVFGIDPKVAMLSYSTFGSGKGEDVDAVRNATQKLKYRKLDFDVDGELQFDAAFSSSTAKIKAPNSSVAGHANIFVFPDINSGNIGYKIAQRLGDFEALGPILQGLNAPINDLSRGCSEEDVFKMAIITANQK